ncbi:MAG: arginase family protein [Azospirillaceae bacterium]|nr:arginase family protein [Azospirillaceae bacterium]
MQTGHSKTTTLTLFEGCAGDRNPRGIAGARLLGRRLATRLGVPAAPVGRMSRPGSGDWRAQLEAARSDLMALAAVCRTSLAAGYRPVTTMGRCAAALATLPAIAHHRPDALVVWFDAHADSNVPARSKTGYLGGLVLSGAAGLWETGLGGALDLRNVLLVGARDIDPDEQALIDAGILRHLPAGPDLPERLAAAITARPVYVHLDCDVLEPGVVPTEYQVPGGLSLNQLQAAATVLAGNEQVGLEIAEFETAATEAGSDDAAMALLRALEPLWALPG